MKPEAPPTLPRASARRPGDERRRGHREGALMRRVLRGVESFWAELTADRPTRESVRAKLMRVVSLTTVIALLVAGSALRWPDGLSSLLDLRSDDRGRHPVDLNGAGPRIRRSGGR